MNRTQQHFGCDHLKYPYEVVGGTQVQNEDGTNIISCASEGIARAVAEALNRMHVHKDGPGGWGIT